MDLIDQNFSLLAYISSCVIIVLRHYAFTAGYDFIQRRFAHVMEDGLLCFTKILQSVVDKVLQPVKVKEKVSAWYWVASMISFHTLFSVILCIDIYQIIAVFHSEDIQKKFVLAPFSMCPEWILALACTA